MKNIKPVHIFSVWTAYRGCSNLQVIVYDHGQVIEDPSLIGRVGFTGIITSESLFLTELSLLPDT